MTVTFNNDIGVKADHRWLLGLVLLSLSMLVWAQSSGRSLQADAEFDNRVTDRIYEDAELWRQSSPEDENVDTGWRVTEPKPRDSRVTWGYDSTYEQLRDNRYNFSGSPSFDYGEERAGTLLRFDF